MTIKHYLVSYSDRSYAYKKYLSYDTVRAHTAKEAMYITQLQHGDRVFIKDAKLLSRAA